MSSFSISLDSSWQQPEVLGLALDSVVPDDEAPVARPEAAQDLQREDANAQGSLFASGSEGKKRGRDTGPDQGALQREEDLEEDDGSEVDDVTFRNVGEAKHEQQQAMENLVLDSIVVDDDGNGDVGDGGKLPASKFRRLDSTIERVRRLLSDSAGGSTVVLEGPPGSGKSTVCRAALSLLGPNVVSVVLRGYLVGTTDASFKALLRALESEKQARNNTELRVFLHQRLVQLTALGKTTVVLLEQAEVFAKQSRQPLLYLLNDLLHDATVRIKLVLTTQGQGERG
jgi:hypothetical protein